MNEKAGVLRELFGKREIVRIVGAHNGLTAKLVEKNGFEGVWASGFEIATSYAVPDANILTMSELVHISSVINDATNLPVIVDCDTGFGNSINVINLVKKLTKLGIAGISIEDKLFPKVNSYIPGRQELASIAEFSGKIMAAKQAQENPDFMVFARVEALIAGWGIDEALKRARVYEKAGADGIFIHSKDPTGKEIEEFASKWDGEIPLIICPTAYPEMHEPKIKTIGNIKMVIYANHGLRASIKAMNEVLSEINREKGIHTINEKIVPMKDAFELQGMFDMKNLEEKFLSSKEDIKVVIPAAGKGGDESLNDLLSDRPVGLLDIGGKSITQRSVEVLNSLGLNDINIITGYKPDLFRKLQDVNLIDNSDFEQKYILDSIMKAREKMDKKTLMIYSDIVFEKEIIEQLMKSEQNITLVIDSSYKTSNIPKPRDLVLAKVEPIISERIMREKKSNEIAKIGRKLSLGEANFEFIGIALLSKKAIDTIKIIYDEVKNSNKEFQGLKNIDDADFIDMIQELIERGIKISALEVNKGWIEINNFRDYKSLCYMLELSNPLPKIP
jgi:phosphoenolpyruvate phosphomutase